MRIANLFALLGMMIVGIAARSQAEGASVEGTWAGFIVEDPKATVVMTFEKDRYTYVQLFGAVVPRKGGTPELLTNIVYRGNFAVHGDILKLEWVVEGKKMESEIHFKVEGGLLYLIDGEYHRVLLRAREEGGIPDKTP